MNSTFQALFGHRIFGDRFLELYTDMARTYTSDCIEQLHTEMYTRTSPLSFSEINQRVAAFNNELINRATWIREDYKENKGYSSPKLTRGCKAVISRCVDNYMRALQLATQAPALQTV